MNPTGNLAGLSRPTIPQPSTGGARQVQDPAAGSAPVSRRAARATVPGRPSPSGPPLEGEGGKTPAATSELALFGAAGPSSPQRRGRAAAAETPAPDTRAAHLDRAPAPDRGRAKTPAGASATVSPPAGSKTRVEGLPRRWVLELPAGMELLSLNGREHWAARNRKTQALKQAAWVLARRAKIPRLERAFITVEYQPPDRRRRDAENTCAASGKACADGLVAAGVLEDDECPRYVTGIYCTIGERYPKGRLVLTITEVTGLAGIGGTG